MIQRFALGDAVANVADERADVALALFVRRDHAFQRWCAANLNRGGGGVTATGVALAFSSTAALLVSGSAGDAARVVTAAVGAKRAPNANALLLDRILLESISPSRCPAFPKTREA